MAVVPRGEASRSGGGVARRELEAGTMASGALPEEGCAAEALRDADGGGTKWRSWPTWLRWDRSSMYRLRTSRSGIDGIGQSSGTVGQHWHRHGGSTVHIRCSRTESSFHTLVLMGCFRRVAHWTVAQMTKATLPAEDDSGRVQRPEDYEEGTLPPWTREAWWRGTPDTLRAFWAALDVELAYPSVRISQLALAMEQALQRPGDFDLDRLFDGCPQPVLEALAVQDVRVEIGRRLTRALGEITMDSGGIPPDSWGAATGPTRCRGYPRSRTKGYLRDSPSPGYCSMWCSWSRIEQSATT